MYDAADDLLPATLPNAVWCGPDNEIWSRDPSDADLWRNKKGSVIPSAALQARMRCSESGFVQHPAELELNPSR